MLGFMLDHNTLPVYKRFQMYDDNYDTVVVTVKIQRFDRLHKKCQ